jgi:hypothetical protein
MRWPINIYVDRNQCRFCGKKGTEGISLQIGTDRYGFSLHFRYRSAEDGFSPYYSLNGFIWGVRWNRILWHKLSFASNGRGLFCWSYNPHKKGKPCCPKMAE